MRHILLLTFLCFSLLTGLVGQASNALDLSSRSNHSAALFEEISFASSPTLELLARNGFSGDVPWRELPALRVNFLVQLSRTWLLIELYSSPVSLTKRLGHFPNYFHTGLAPPELNFLA